MPFEAILYLSFFIFIVSAIICAVIFVVTILLKMFKIISLTLKDIFLLSLIACLPYALSLIISMVMAPKNGIVHGTIFYLIPLSYIPTFFLSRKFLQEKKEITSKKSFIIAGSIALIATITAICICVLTVMILVVGAIDTTT